MANVIIAGAGISGLSAAHWIKKLGHNVLVLEKSSRTGGVIETLRQDGYLFEKGPNSFLDNVPETMELCSELQLDNELLKQSLRDNKRFIFLNDKLHEVPNGPGGLYHTEILSRKTKKKLFTELFRKGNRSPEDESLASFIRRRFGEEILHRIVTPFVSGVYAGDPEKLSLRATFPLLYELERQHGSLTRGMISRMFRRKKNSSKKKRAKNLCSFVDGMSSLTDALTRELKNDLRLNASIHSVRHLPHGGFQIVTGDPISQPVEGHALVLAVPAYAAADIAEPLLPRTAPYLRTIPYNRLNVIGLGFRKQDVQHACDGFGYLVPRNQGVRILGSIWSSSLFVRRAPAGERCFTIFIGGGLDPDAYDLPDEELRSQVKEDLFKTVGVNEDPRCQHIFRWEKAIPQYPVGHVEKIENLQLERSAVPGLFLTGNYLNGVSTNDCIRNGKEVAAEVHEFLNSSSSDTGRDTP